MTSKDDDPTGWKALLLTMGYRQHGASLEHPWLELTSDELRALMAKGGEILRAIDDAAAESSAGEGGARTGKEKR
jgi:hypothetical protein